MMAPTPEGPPSAPPAPPPDAPRWHSGVLWGVVAAALVARLVVVALRPPTAADLGPLADAGDYDHLARMLLEGRGFVAPGGEPTAFRPPVYAFWLAGIYALFGAGNLLAVAVSQAVLGALNAWLAGSVARLAGLGWRAGLLAAAGVGLYPPFVAQAPQILTEELARTLLLATVAGMLRARAGGSAAAWVLAGGLAALAILNKSVLAATIPFLGLWVLAGHPSWRMALRSAVLFAAPAALLLGGWSARNAVASGGTFIPVSTNFPITFSYGVTRWSYYTNTWYGSEVELLATPEDFQALTQLRFYRGIEEERRVGAEWSGRAVVWIADHPGFFARLTARKAVHFWGPFIRASWSQRALAFACMAPVLVLGWVFVLRTLWRRAGEPPARALAWLMLAIALPVTLPYAISQPDVRYRLSLIDPLWIIGAGVVVAGWRSSLSGAGAGRAGSTGD